MLVANDLLSERRACRLVGVSRTAQRHVSTRALTDKLVQERLQALAAQYPRYGYLVLHGLLKNEGMVINRKRI